MSSPSVSEIREILQDTPFGNPKYMSEYFREGTILKAISWAEKHVAGSPPMNVIMSASQVPDYIMLNGVLGYLFSFRILNLSINYTPGINDNGIQLQLGEEMEKLKELMNTYMATFDGLLREYKRNVNIRGGFATLTSPHYRNCNGGYH